MADFKPNITRTLSLSGGSEVAHATVTRISCKANQGWSWSAVVNSDSGPDPYQSLFTPTKSTGRTAWETAGPHPICWITLETSRTDRAPLDLLSWKWVEWTLPEQK